MRQRGRKTSPGPNRWRGGRERGGRRTRLREKLCCSFFFFSFSTGARCSGADNYFMRGDMDFFFLSDIFGSIFIVFAVLLLYIMPFCAFSFVHTRYIQHKKKKKISTRTLPGVCTYVRCDSWQLSSRQFETTIIKNVFNHRPTSVPFA